MNNADIDTLLNVLEITINKLCHTKDKSDKVILSIGIKMILKDLRLKAEGIDNVRSIFSSIESSSMALADVIPNYKLTKDEHFKTILEDISKLKAS